ncbi:MAG: 30S ribosomal protein S20 [Myxococcales bacterium]|nr:30S ribosomal protein S20 [Myxococcota bacterium]MDW8280103.1 30S ribosomal protein S20 [Myxococcales bacterium]
MANVPSAEKRNRQRIKRRLRNQHHLSTTRTYVKRAVAALTGNASLEEARTRLAEAISRLDRAAQKGIIKRKTASRKISRLTRALARKAAAQPA